MTSCLIVDDSGTIRKIIRKILEPYNFDIREAEDGQKAYDTCKSQGMPDIIFLDWNMPVMNGLEFLHTLRADPDGQSPKVIFCTTENDMDHIQKAILGGANEYVMKPFDQNIIQEKLEQVGAI